MVLKNYSQNRSNSESNVSKNTPNSCASNFSACRVKKLIQKYEDLSVSAKNNNLQSGIKHCSSEQYISKRNSAMLGDAPINLDKNSVFRFLSLDDHQTNNKYVFNEYRKNENKPNVHSDNVADTCDKKMPSHSKSSSKSNFKIYIDESSREKSRQSQGYSPSSAKRSENSIWKLFTNFNEPDKDKKHNYNRSVSNETRKQNTNHKYTSNEKLNKDRKQEYSNSLPNGKKKQENSFGKNFIRSFSATTSRDKKLKPLSTSNQQYNRDNKVKTLPKDGSSIVKTRIETLQPVNQNTGAIKKQLEPNDVIYRKRRDSYLMATQNDDNFRKLKIYPEKKENNSKQSYVSKTISKFETKNDIMTVVDLKARNSKSKFEHDIKQLFQQYHDNKKFGTSNKMTREELSLEIDNVLLNKFKQISDNPQEMYLETSGAGNHSNSHQTIDSTLQNTEPEETITVIVQQPEVEIHSNEETDIQTDYVIIVRESTDETSNDVDVYDKSQGQGASKLNLESTDSETESELNVREKLSAQLIKVLSNDNLKNSVENLCDDIQKDLDVINKSLSEIGVEIKDVSVIDPDNENMYENFDYNRSVSCPNNLNKTEERIYENLKYIQEKINERQQCETEQNEDDNTVLLREIDEDKPKRKVSNLVSYFTDKIAEVSLDSKRSTLDNRKSISFTRTNSNEQKHYNDDEVFRSPTTERRAEEFCYSPETNHIPKDNSSDSTSSTSGSYEENSDKIEETTPENSYLNTVNPSVVNISYITEEDYQNNYEASNISISSTSSSSADVIVDHHKNLPQQSRLYRRKSSKTDISSEENFELNQSNINIKDITTLSVQQQAELLRNELENEIMKERKYSINKRKDSENSYDSSHTEVVEEIQPRLSRLYSGKFLRNQSVIQDTNNNEFVKTTQTQEPEEKLVTNPTEEETNICEETAETIRSTSIEHPNESNEEEHIYNTIEDDTLFFSGSEGDYDITEAYNYDNFYSQQQRSVSDWVQSTRVSIEKYNRDKYEDEDTEHIYEIIKRSESSGTLCTIYDEQNNPAIRFSMLDITGEFSVFNDEQTQDQKIEDEKIEESEKELRKNIVEIQDNSKKACLINELITTERNYINNSLHRLVHDYMPEMDKIDIPKGLVGKNRQIFGNADIIYEGHKDKFLPSLERHSCIEDLANCFLKHETIFKLYPLYSKNKPKSDVVLRDYGFFFKAKQDALNDKLDLASYLLTPIQRLSKYCLLVKSLVKECEKENIACEKLKCALEMLNKQMRMGNDLIALDSIVNYNGNIRDQGEVLLRDTFMVQPPNKKPAYEGMLFLFQECLIITAVNRQDFMETFIYKESFQLTDMGYSDIESEPLEFSVWYRKRDIKMYRFRTKNQEVKQKWVKEIFNLLWKQLEANKRRRKKELEENGVRDTRVPVVRPYSIPNRGNSVKRKDSGSSTKKSRKQTLNSSSAETIWYTLANT